MDAPTHLKHKPIVSINDYDQIDGIYAHNSDAKALSIGKAQYDIDEISAKVWRKTGRWSRQSEELPLHRVIDLAELIVNSVLMSQGQTVNSNISNIPNSNISEINNYYTANQHVLEPRLRNLRDAIDKLIP
jgi:hypothetical protein